MDWDCGISTKGVYLTFKVFETWVVLIINDLDYPSFKNFESRPIYGQPGMSMDNF